MDGKPKGLTVKDLKSRVDDSELDLSMCELVDPPTKELAQVKSAVRLDLSVNRMELLGDDFAPSLSHLVHLDLSRNALRQLPDNFGELRNLRHLDLFKNQLTSLPLSFALLKQLKWLDLKDNELDADLRAAAGDCLDDAQCRRAAARVVALMQKSASATERARQQRLDAERRSAAEVASRKQADEREEQALRKRERDRRKQQKNEANRADAKRAGNAAAATPSPQKSRVSKSAATKSAADASPSSVGGRICSTVGAVVRALLTWLAVSALIAAVAGLATAGVIYHNCSHPGGPWLPDSGALCADVYTVLATGVAPASTGPSLLAAATASRDSAVDAAFHVYEAATTANYSAAFASAVDGAARAAQTARHSAADAASSLRKLYLKELHPVLQDVFVKASSSLSWTWQRLTWLTRWLMSLIVSYSVMLTSMAQDAFANRDIYWEKFMSWFSAKS